MSVEPDPGSSFIPGLEGRSSIRLEIEAYYERSWGRWRRREGRQTITVGTGTADHDRRGEFMPVYDGTESVGDVMRGGRLRIYYADIVR